MQAYYKEADDDADTTEYTEAWLDRSIPVALCSVPCVLSVRLGSSHVRLESHGGLCVSHRPEATQKSSAGSSCGDDDWNSPSA